jgi:hypothetical protein
MVIKPKKEEAVETRDHYNVQKTFEIFDSVYRVKSEYKFQSPYRQKRDNY